MSCFSMSSLTLLVIVVSLVFCCQNISTHAGVKRFLPPYPELPFSPIVVSQHSQLERMERLSQLEHQEQLERLEQQ